MYDCLVIIKKTTNFRQLQLITYREVFVSSRLSGTIQMLRRNHLTPQQRCKRSEKLKIRTISRSNTRSPQVPGDAFYNKSVGKKPFSKSTYYTGIANLEL